MNSKTQSILSYLGIFWLLAFIAGKEQRDGLSRFHLKQGLGLLALALLCNSAVYIIGLMIPSIAGILSISGFLFVILMAFGVVHAVNEVEKPLPLIGKLFENKFGFIH